MMIISVIRAHQATLRLVQCVVAISEDRSVRSVRAAPRGRASVSSCRLTE
jgi:hypothetical protein